MTNNSPPTVNSYSVHEDGLKWFDVPLVAGGKAALLHGDPTKAGTVVLRFKFPPHRQTPPYRHPYAEYTAILSGKVYYGEGKNLTPPIPELEWSAHSLSYPLAKRISYGRYPQVLETRLVACFN